MLKRTTSYSITFFTPQHSPTSSGLASIVEPIPNQDIAPRAACRHADKALPCRFSKTSLPGNVTKKKLNNRYRNISVKISDLKVKVEDKKAWAYFTQQYRSDSFLAHGYKLIEFQKEGHSWKIFRERSFAKNWITGLGRQNQLNR